MRARSRYSIQGRRRSCLTATAWHDADGLPGDDGVPLRVISGHDTTYAFVSSNGWVGMLEQSRYIIETNIGRFRQHLRSGLLDAGQTRTVSALLAEALEELDEFDRRRAIGHRQAADQRSPPPRAY
jgi:hypothetical protein